MRLVRFRFGDRIATGAVDDGGDAIRVLRGTFFEDPVPTGEEIPLDDVRLLAPVLPSKVVCLGKNYAAHAAEFGGEVPEEPLIFLKPSTSVSGPGDPIPLPAISHRVDFEGELAVVIGTRAKNVDRADALQYVAGLTIAHDVSARDHQFTTGQFTWSKSFDTFCPLGPEVVSLDEVDLASGLPLETKVNGEVMQSANTSELVYDVPALIRWISQGLTLETGDVILTGTPGGVGAARTPPRWLQNGDVVEISIGGLGTLRNPVVRS
jgi:2-keto-4-pentenoate hydratase/2-oxohepta-3-ene-1,7-dioic acid hydratase in catechol pathway